MTGPTVQEVSDAIRRSWCRESCDTVDVDDWSPANPARGQCGSTALTVHDLLGGDLLVAEVLHGDGTFQGFHYWNRLSPDLDIDLTLEQFSPDELVQTPTVVERPPGLPRRGAEQYLALRDRTLNALRASGARSTIEEYDRVGR